MKVDRSVLSNNDQQMGQVADPDKIEASINHLADVIDTNDTQKTDKTGDHQGTWMGVPFGEASEAINGGRLNVIEEKIPTFLVGAGQRIEIHELSFVCDGGSNIAYQTRTFSSAFTTIPSITPMNMTQNVSNNDQVMYPFFYGLSATNFSVRLQHATGANFGAGTIKMKFLVIGK